TEGSAFAGTTPQVAPAAPHRCAGRSPPTPRAGKVPPVATAGAWAGVAPPPVAHATRPASAPRPGPQGGRPNRSAMVPAQDRPPRPAPAVRGAGRRSGRSPRPPAPVRPPTAGRPRTSTPAPPDARADPCWPD